jgi:hypothetical protein
MMDMDDPRWNGLLGGYRLPYDPRSALLSLERGQNVDAAWSELWQELHHQSDVGEASYAAVPHLVRIHAQRGIPDWNTYAMVATIEDIRHEPDNPAIPPWLRQSYDEALRQLVTLGLEEFKQAETQELIDSIYAVLAIGKGRLLLARFAMFTEDEREELLNGAGFGR